MDFEFELVDSKVEGIEKYGKIIFGEDEETVSVNITVRKGEEDYFVCLPSRKGKDDKYYAEVFLGSKLYEKVNKKINKLLKK